MRKDHPKILRGIDMEIALVLRELGNARPRSLGRSAHEPEDFLQLILVGSSREKRASSVHFGHDAASRPNIDACVVRPASEQNVRRAIPQCHDLIREGIHGDTESASEAEIGKFELAAGIDEQVLGLQVTV